MNKLIPALFLLFLARIAWCDDAPTTMHDDAEKHLRNTFGIQKLNIMRQSTEDAELDDDVRKGLLKAMDDARDSALDAIQREKKTPSDPESLAGTVSMINANLRLALVKYMEADPTLRQRLTTQGAMLQLELKDIANESITAQLQSTGITDDQQTRIKEIAADAAEKMKSPPPDLPESEGRFAIAVQARKKIYEVLSDDQRKQWKEKLAAAVPSSPFGGRRGAAPAQPVPPAATPQPAPQQP